MYERQALTRAGAARAGKAPRTERDLSAGWISVVTLVLVAVLVITFQVFLAGAPLSAAAIWKLVAYAVLFAFVFGFLVAAACGYMAVSYTHLDVYKRQMVITAPSSTPRNVNSGSVTSAGTVVG